MSIQPFENRFGAELQKLIAEDLTRLHNEVGVGLPTDAYREKVGEIRGLKLALKHIQYVHDDMTGRKRKQEKD